MAFTLAVTMMDTLLRTGAEEVAAVHAECKPFIYQPATSRYYFVLIDRCGLTLNTVAAKKDILRANVRTRRKTHIADSMFDT